MKHQPLTSNEANSSLQEQTHSNQDAEENRMELIAPKPPETAPNQ
jgi:hypothetical protein